MPSSFGSESAPARLTGSQQDRQRRNRQRQAEQTAGRTGGLFRPVAKPAAGRTGGGQVLWQVRRRKSPPSAGRRPGLPISNLAERRSDLAVDLGCEPANVGPGFIVLGSVLVHM
jgi:hypothetical protein